MAIPQTDVIGPLVLPNGTAPFGARLKFELVKWDKDSGETILMGPVFADCDAAGDFTTALWPSTEGVNSTSYAVSATYYNGDQDKVITEVLGFISVPVTGPVLLADLLTVTATPITTPEGLALMAAYLAAAEAAEASAAAAAAIATAAVANIKIEYSTLADMVADPALTVGTLVKTLGYWAAGDGGDNVYEIVAAATGTADGGSFIDLTGSSLQAKGLFGGNVLHAATFGATGSLLSGPTGDVSDRINNFSAYAIAAWIGGSVAPKLVYDGVLNIAEPVYLAGRPDEFGGQDIQIDSANSIINVIAGGSLELVADQTAVIVKSRDSIHNLGTVQCNHFCGGYLFNQSVNSKVLGARVEGFTWRGWHFSDNCAGMVLSGLSGYEWTISEPEFNTDANFISTGILLNVNDVKVVAANVGYAKIPIEFALGDLGESAVGCELHGCHPFNGNPLADGVTIMPRSHPFCIVNNQSANVYMYETYVDNGYVVDNGGSLIIQGGHHYVGNSRVTLTHPFTRVKQQADPSAMNATVSDFDSSFGIFTGAFTSDFSGAVTNFNYTIADMRNSQRKFEYLRRKTRIIGLSDNTIETNIVKQGAGNVKIVEQYRAGTDTLTQMKYGNAILTVSDGATAGEIRVSETTRCGFGSGGDTLILYANGSEVGRFQNTLHFAAGSDNLQDLGRPTARWKSVYAGTGTINTSDRREKTTIKPIDDAVLDAWANIEWSQFHWVSSLAEKGDDARVHFGLIAQDIKDVFEAAGLDPFKYGVLCFDEWDEETDDDGNVTLEAGNRYGVRYDQAQAIEAAYMRRELKLLRGKKK